MCDADANTFPAETACSFAIPQAIVARPRSAVVATWRKGYGRSERPFRTAYRTPDTTCMG